ncbi:hypothetical protein, partial [Xanthomonas axonopodis]|uniref:hypothetical protein n=1 Tax=Xanthomonas axonopodis TaxID=53413 RepID=UPI001ADB556D
MPQAPHYQSQASEPGRCSQIAWLRGQRAAASCVDQTAADDAQPTFGQECCAQTHKKRRSRAAQLQTPTAVKATATAIRFSDFRFP